MTVAVCAVTCGIGLAAFGYTLEGVPGGAVALMLAAAFALALVPLAVGFLLGQLGVGEATTNAVGNIGGMVMAFMGGAWISLDLLGAEMQTAAKFFPTYWYTQAVTESAHLAEVTWETAAPILANLGVIVLFAAAVFAVALAAGRVRMRSAEAGGNAAASLTRGRKGPRRGFAGARRPSARAFPAPTDGRYLAAPASFAGAGAAFFLGRPGLGGLAWRSRMLHR